MCGGEARRLQDDRDYFLLEQERDVHFIICPMCSAPHDHIPYEKLPLCDKGRALIDKCMQEMQEEQ